MADRGNGEARRADGEGLRLLVFDAEGRSYACDLGAVRGIVPFQPATRLPGAPPSVVGLINVRGRLVTVIDLAVHVGTREPGVRRPDGGSIVLVGAGPRTVGMVVDDVRDVRRAGREAIEEIRDVSVADGAVRALVRLEDGSAALIDADTLVSSVLQ